MPPSASATPPTQTTQRVPNFSSKPIFCGVDDWTGEATKAGLTLVAALVGQARAQAPPVRQQLEPGAGSAVAGVAARGATRAPSSAFTLASSCRNRLRSVMLLDQGDNADDRRSQQQQHDQNEQAVHRSPRPQIAIASLECGVAHPTPGRGGTARLLRQDSPGRWSRWRRPCGRRGRATDRQATRCGYWASPSARRDAAPARCRSRRAAD